MFWQITEIHHPTKPAKGVCSSVSSWLPLSSEVPSATPPLPSMFSGGVQLLCCIQLFATPWTAAHQASPSFTISWSFLKFMSIESVMPSNHLILCCSIPFSFHPQSFTTSGSFPVSQLFATDDQSIRASASVLRVSIQGWFPLGLTYLTSLPSRGLSRVFSSTTVWKYQLFGTQPFLWFNSHICTWLLEKP